MDQSNRVHPTAILGPDVVMGRDNIIGPYTVILGPASIGDANWIGPSVVIGTPGESRGGLHPVWDVAQGVGVRIGHRNVIREFVTVQQGMEAPTVVGNDCYLMTKAHIPHEGEIEDSVTIACAAQVGGHGWVGEGANVGLGAQLRQRSCVGAFAMVGMNLTVTRDIPPFALVMGSPARVVGVNRVGMLRRGFSEGLVRQLDERYKNGDFSCPDSADEAMRRTFVRFEDRQASRSTT